MCVCARGLAVHRDNQGKNVNDIIVKQNPEKSCPRFLFVYGHSTPPQSSELMSCTELVHA